MMKGALCAASVITILVVFSAACTPDLRLIDGAMRPVTSDIVTGRAVHDRQDEVYQSRQVRFLGRSKDGQTGYKEHLVGWRGPGTNPQKVVLSFPLIVHDAQYRWRVHNIFGGPYRSRWGGYCGNFKYYTQRQGTSAPRVNYAFACQHRDGNWYAFKNRRESPARNGAMNQGNLQRLIQQMLQ